MTLSREIVHSLGPIAMVALSSATVLGAGLLLIRVLG